MNFEIWILYLLAAAAATATPGPAVLLIINRSIRHGWQKTLFVASGNVTALLIMSIISVSGLGIILNTSETVFAVIKYLGAAYLVYMGLKMFLKKNYMVLEKDELLRTDKSSAKLFLEAFTTAVSNPKAIVFLNALFPQFIDQHQSFHFQFVILISTLMLLSFSFLMFYSVLASKARSWFYKNSRMKFFNKLSGSLFFGLGITLAFSEK